MNVSEELAQQIIKNFKKALEKRFIMMYNVVMIINTKERSCDYAIYEFDHKRDCER